MGLFCLCPVSTRRILYLFSLLWLSAVMGLMNHKGIKILHSAFLWLSAVISLITYQGIIISQNLKRRNRRARQKYSLRYLPFCCPLALLRVVT